MIKALGAKLEYIRQAELVHFRQRAGDHDFEKADRLTRRITNKILAHAIHYIKENREEPETVSRMIESMFKLEQKESMFQ